MRIFLEGIALLFIVFLVEEISANCKAHDAEWIKGKPIRISIPHRSEPGKVLVDWTQSMKNGRCSDRFEVFVWETHRGEGFTKNYTTPGGTYSRIVELDPCVEYQFKIGFFENNLFGKETKNSSVAKFKTEAIPTLGSTDKSQFQVQVYFDKITQKLDYNKASIRFPKTLLKHTSCLKYIEADGIENVATLTTSRGYNSHFNKIGDITPLSRSTSYSNIASGSSSRSLDKSGRYGSSSSIGSSGSYGGYNSFGTSGSFGGSGFYSGSHGGSGSYGHASSGSNKPSSGNFLGSFTGTAGNTVNVPLDPYHYNDGHIEHDHSFGNHGRADFSKVSQKRFKRGLFGNNRVSTTPTPGRYDLRSRTNKPSPSQHTTYKPISGVTVNAKILPPFVEDIIEIVVPIKPCSSYTFSVKFVSPQGATLGIVKDLKYLQLSEMHNYHPPTLTEIFKVGTPVSANAPFVSLEPYSGIPVKCVLPILKAVDRHMGHLEDELHFHLKKEFESIGYGNKMKSKILGQKEHSLESAGCECSTPLLHFNTTDPKQLSKHKTDGLFGTFVYEGMQNGRPYYRRPPTSMDVTPTTKAGKNKRNRRFVGKIGTDSSNSRSFGGGFTRGGSTSSSHSAHSLSSSADQHLVIPNTPIIKDPPPPGKVYYVFWNTKEKSWWVGTTLQADKPLYKTNKKNPAKCPGDTKTVKKWTVPHTFSWKVDPHMVMSCKKQVL
uniref:Fibronectin type-III domain-containing protein n=1 Tax=Lepeophtheirus salmonis TaxID=72036 RepID=A0A0K2V3X2_LEPSM